jgi:hypothetical protein
MNYITYYKHKNTLKYFQGLLSRIKTSEISHLKLELEEIENSYNEYLQTMESLKLLMQKYDNSCKQWKKDYSIVQKTIRQQEK